VSWPSKPFDFLKVRPFTRATSTWANNLIDAVNEVYDISMFTLNNTLNIHSLENAPVDVSPAVDAFYDLGSPLRRWNEVWAMYGFFDQDLYVQGKKVIKDEDPVNIYDIFPPAQDRLRVAFLNALVESYLAKMAEKIYDIEMDEYGNVGVIIARPVELGNIAPDAFYALVSAMGLADVKSLITGFTATAQEQISSSVASGLDYSSSFSLLKDSASLTASLALLTKLNANSGRLLLSNEWNASSLSKGPSETDLGLVRIAGTGFSYEIVRYDQEGLPAPPSTGSPYVFKITINPGYSVYVRFPLKARFYKPISAYIPIYTPSPSLTVDPYVDVGSLYMDQVRNKLPQPLKLSQSVWSRVIVHWYSEADRGTPEAVLVLTNNDSVSPATVYIASVTADEIEYGAVGPSVLAGWDENLSLDVSGSLSFDLKLHIPPSPAESFDIRIGYALAGDGTNPTNLNIIDRDSGITLVNDSETSSTPVYREYIFSIFSRPSQPSASPSLSLGFDLSTSGTGRLTSLQIAILRFAPEHSFQQYVSGIVDASSSVTIDHTPKAHIKGADLSLTAPADGAVEVYGGPTPLGESKLCYVPAGTARQCRISGRYRYIRIYNGSTTSTATYEGVLEFSSSYLR